VGTNYVNDLQRVMCLSNYGAQRRYSGWLNYMWSNL